MAEARAYYNEFDPEKAAWLRELIRRGVIAPGDVDERDIRDVRPADLDGYTQCHWFAGIGVWSYAARLAGWPDDQPIWTASCPCQPFSQAGAGNGFADERHLWPALFHIIRVRRPDLIVGEQVASLDGLVWLDLVHSDLEGETYPIGAIDLCSAGVGAPNKRQRLFFMAHTDSVIGKQGGAIHGGRHTRGDAVAWTRPRGSCRLGALADPDRHGRASMPSPRVHDEKHYAEPCSVLGDTRSARLEGHQFGRNGANQRLSGPAGMVGPVNGFWRDAEWVWMRDGKFRPVEPGTFPLASGAAARVVRLRGYGDAINAEAAAEFIRQVIGILGVPVSGEAVHG